MKHDLTFYCLQVQTWLPPVVGFEREYQATVFAGDR